MEHRLQGSSAKQSPLPLPTCSRTFWCNFVANQCWPPTLHAYKAATCNNMGREQPDRRWAGITGHGNMGRSGEGLEERRHRDRQACLRGGERGQACRNREGHQTHTLLIQMDMLSTVSSSQALHSAVNLEDLTPSVGCLGGMSTWKLSSVPASP